MTGSTSKGGGLYFGSGTLTLHGVTFEYNNARIGNGYGIYRVTGTMVAPNPDVTFRGGDNEVVGS